MKCNKCKGLLKYISGEKVKEDGLYLNPSFKIGVFICKNSTCELYGKELPAREVWEKNEPSKFEDASKRLCQWILCDLYKLSSFPEFTKFWDDIEDEKNEEIRQQVIYTILEFFKKNIDEIKEKVSEEI
jgi:hypothetical protein